MGTILVISAVIILGLLITVKILSSKLTSERKRCVEYEDALKNAVSENEMLREEMKIKSRNEREANEKTNSLRAGVLSADDILPK